MDRLGVGFAGGLTPPQVVACVRRAEELGYESAWVTEGHGGDHFAILAACATATTRIRLGTAVSSVYVRAAPTVAMAAAVVDHLSGGRFILGLGSSHRVQVEGEYGVPYERPIPRVLDYVEVVRRLLRDGAVAGFRGETVAIRGFELDFAPLRRQVPVYLAAVSPKMLRIAGRTAEGAILAWSGVEQARRSAQLVAEGAAEAGKEPGSVEFAALLPCNVSEDKDEARRRVVPPIALYAATFPRYRRLMEELGFAEEVRAVKAAWDAGDRSLAQRLVPAPLIDELTLVGTGDECREGIRRFREAGVTLPILTPRVSGSDKYRQVMDAIEACTPLTRPKRE